jgi:hypothetical protein
LTKNWLGDFLGDFSGSLGDFFYQKHLANLPGTDGRSDRSHLEVCHEQSGKCREVQRAGAAANSDPGDC